MKNLFCSLIAIISFGCNTDALKVTVDSQYSGEAYLYNTITKKTDTIELSGNTFVVNSIDIEKPTLYYLMFDKINTVNRPIYIILSNQETDIKFNDLTSVNGNTQNIKDLYPNKPLFLSDPNYNQEFYEFQELWINFFNAVTNPHLNIEEKKDLYTRFISASEKLINKNQDKLVAAFMIEYLMNNNLLGVEKIQFFFSKLSPDVQKTIIGERIRDEVGFQTQTLAPNFSLQDYHGNRYFLDSLKGNKVLLHFWSSTCAPCIKEVPDLLKLTKEKKDLIIINISLDTDSIRWISGMERLGIIDMVNFCDYNGANGKIATDYHISSIPANYLIDENGNILLKKETIQGLIEKL